MKYPGTAALLGAAILAMVPQAAAGLPTAGKLIALVSSQGCEWATLSPRLDNVAQVLRDDRRTTRVSIDRPADPERNLDLAGRPSPFIAAIEASAPSFALRGLGRELRRGLGAECSVAVYLVHERRLLTTPRTWPLGEPAPTSKALVVSRRKPGLSVTAFDREWAGPHAELALAWRRARGGDGHYVQNLVVGSLGGDAPPADGIGESEGPGAGPPDPQERQARMRTAAHSRAFQAEGSSRMFIARETVLKD